MPASDWFAAMNLCDIVRGDTGQATFRAGMEILVSDEPASVIEEFLKSCLGRMSEVAGKFYIRAGGPGPSVLAFTDEQIVYTKDEEFNPIKTSSDTYNGISGVYFEPESGWNSQDAPLRINTTYLQEDHSVTNVASLSYPAVPYNEQVQRLMATALKDARKSRVHTLYLMPEARPLTPVDYVTYSSHRNGYITKLFAIEGVQVVPNGEEG